MTYLPDKAYLLAHKNDASNNWLNKMDKDFCGYLEYKNWDGSIQYVIRILNGKKLARYIINGSGSLNKAQVNSLKKVDGQVCYLVQSEDWGYNYTVDGDGNTSDPMYIFYGYESQTVCYDDGNNNSSPTPQPTTPDGTTPSGTSGGGSFGDGASPGATPLATYADKCTGAAGLWSRSINNGNAEAVGVMLTDGHILDLGTVGALGGSFNGFYNWSNGSTTTVYYTYPVGTPGETAPSYPGLTTVKGVYYIPITALIHTHSPCLVDGTNGVDQNVSADDLSTAAAYSNINYYVIGCGAVASFNQNSTTYNILGYGSLSTTCSSFN